MLLGTVVTALVAGFSLLRRVEVSGHSMLPTLWQGDRVLAVRCRRARPGQLVVVRDPRLYDRLLVKRVVSMEGNRAVVRGDNTGSSTDSSVFGTVRIEARVVYRYAPGGRTGQVH
ncbi:MAG TPA: S26 family signal peptidase [Acidimicrobiales bacterium]|nr:S26 family signal peptidase [Acidimicrobiales bacterium]